MKKVLSYLLMAATVCGISFAAASCSSSDDENYVEALTVQQLAGLWVTDYAENGSYGNATWTRVVENCLFRADGTGYYECYALDGQKYVGAEVVRGEDGEGEFHYTISGNTVTITYDKTSAKLTLTYADGKLTAPDRVVFQKATIEQQTLVNQLYGEWQKANSGSGGDDDNNLNDVNGNVDVNNGGGGVNVVR